MYYSSSEGVGREFEIRGSFDSGIEAGEHEEYRVWMGGLAYNNRERTTTEFAPPLLALPSLSTKTNASRTCPASSSVIFYPMQSD